MYAVKRTLTAADANAPESAWLSRGQAAFLCGVAGNTVLYWEKKGHLKPRLSAGGRRRYNAKELLDRYETVPGVHDRWKTLCSGENVFATEKREESKRRVVYCRVSSVAQKEDLKRQKARLQELYPDHEVLCDIGSGLNFKRKNLLKILDAACSGVLEELVVAHRDRLTRFGFELIEHVVVSRGGRVVVLDDGKSSPEKELVSDLLSIITVFSDRLPGLRANKTRQKVRKDAEGTNTTEPATQTAAEQGAEERTTLDA